MKKGTSATLNKKLNPSFNKVRHWTGKNYVSKVFYSRLILTAHQINTCLCHVSLITLRSYYQRFYMFHSCTVHL